MSRLLVVGFRARPDKKALAYLSQKGWEVLEVAPSHLAESQPIPPFDAALFFFGRDGYEAGISILQALRGRPEEVPVVCVTRTAHLEEAVETMRRGAFDYFKSPVDLEKLSLSLQNATRLSHLRRRLLVLESQVGSEGSLDDMVGASLHMQEVYRTVQTVAKSNATVLIMGESGTGKELVARAIHRHSERTQKKFIDINCAAIPRELLENELFGHEKGAFTGADRLYIGSCERANEGTLFLDEVSEMDPALQVKLLRVLQERSFMRVGGTETIHVDIRVIAATNKDLRAEIDKGNFREDLFYRLNVVPVTIAPLRERRDDIPILAQFFLEKYAKENRKEFKGFNPEAMELLVNYDWPGNVREVENNIERIVVLNDDSRVKLHHLPRFIANVEKGKVPATAWDAAGYQKILPLQLVEQYAIESAMERCRGDAAAAAKKLGIGQATMYRKIKRYGIRVS